MKKGKGLTQKVLKGTKIISRALKFIGPKGSTLHHAGHWFDQKGYGFWDVVDKINKAPKNNFLGFGKGHNHLAGRMYLV